MKKLISMVLAVAMAAVPLAAINSAAASVAPSYFVIGEYYFPLEAEPVTLSLTDLSANTTLDVSATGATGGIAFDNIESDGVTFSGTGWSWNTETFVLTLTDFETSPVSGHGIHIDVGANVATIVLVGANVVYAELGDGIQSESDLIITSESGGTLDISGLAGCGIYCFYDITIGGSASVNAEGINAISGSNGGSNLTIDTTGEVNAVGLADGLQGASVTISGGAVNAYGEYNGIYSAADTTIEGDAEVLAEGGDFAVSAFGALNLDGGSLTTLPSGTVADIYGQVNENGGAFNPPIAPTESPAASVEPIEPTPSQGGVEFPDATTPAPTATSTPAPITPPVTEWANPFYDVHAGDWFFGDVEYVVTNGLIGGASETMFEPHSPMTRGMLVSVLAILANAELNEYANGGFADVDNEREYAAAVAWARENNIVYGIGNDLFAPDAEIARQELAVILLRYIQSAGIDLNVTAQHVLFADAEEIADYAEEAIQTLNKLGVIIGVGNNKINPKGFASVAEIAAILHRFLLIPHVPPSGSSGA